MIIVKPGAYHTEYGLNCQDAAVEFNVVDNEFGNSYVKCIVDGCSEGEHSEVGAQLFCLMRKQGRGIKDIFNEMNKLFLNPADKLNYMLFTILQVEEFKDNFQTDVCGDGYIILQDHNDKITYEKFDYEGAPPYYAYNYFPKDKLKKYQEGVNFKQSTYSKEEYKAVGVASDGLQYILDTNLRTEFEQLLISRRLVAIKRFINKHAIVFKDDISIAI